MQKESATNTFNKGLVMDFNPIVLPLDTLCNALNATIITMNGNENVLLNDMGNGRVETAYLPEGYIPLGSALLGGIIYIVSYNPLRNMCLIGSFPSPERNITSTEKSGETEKYISEVNFFNEKFVKTPYQKLIIYEDTINPGDKYLIACSEIANSGYISAYGLNKLFRSLLLPRYLKFSPIAIALNGSYTDLSDACVWLPVGSNQYYYISINDTLDSNTEDTDIDEYRNLVSSRYNVFFSKLSGLLGVLGSLECIDSFEISWDAYKEDDLWNFYFFLNWTYNNEVSPDKINLYGIYIDNVYIEKNLVETNDQDSIEKYKSDDEDEDDITRLESCSINIDLYPHYTKETENTTESDIELGGTDIMKYQEIVNDDYTTIFCTPDYIDSLENIINNPTESIYKNNSKIFRKNDGSDNLFLLETPYQVGYTKGKLKFTVYPEMPFGALSWLGQSFNIDLSKLGSGEIDLSMYKYYIDNNNITLSWGLEAYPERNKKINGVKFQFYAISQEMVENWINTNKEYIDSCKGINDEWIDCESEKSTGITYKPINDDYKYTYQFEDIGKASYNGNFSNTLTFENLEKYTTYIVLIRINYNGSYVDYYRILFTEPILNSKYYKERDFSTINLSEILELLLKAIESDIVEQTSSINSCTDVGVKIDKIPSYLSDSNTSVDYIIKDEYNLRVKCRIEGTVGYDSFKVNIDTSEIQKDNISYCNTWNNKEDISAASIFYSSLYSRETKKPTLDINIEPSGNPVISDDILTINFKVTTDAHLEITYDNQSSIVVPYRFVPISVASMFICGLGSKLAMGISASRSIIYSIKEGDDYSFIENDGHREIELESSNGIYSSILSDLIDNDVVCIGGLLHKGLHNSPYGIVWGFGSWSTIGGTSNGEIYVNHARWASNVNTPDSNPCMILFYAMKQGSNIILFSYATGKIEYQSIYGQKEYPSHKWFNVTDEEGKSIVTCGGYPGNNNSLKAIYAWNIHTDCTPPAFLVSNATNNDYIKDEIASAPFTNLYKLKSYGEGLLEYLWSIIDYYPSFLETFGIDICIDKNLKTEVCVNNLSYSNEYVKGIKNLYYPLQESCTLKYENSRIINTDSIIKAITSDSVNFVAYDTDSERKVIEMDVSPTKIYKRTNDTFTTILYLPGLVNDESVLSVRCDNELMKIETNSSNFSLCAAWMYDDMGIAIKNIFVI